MKEEMGGDLFHEYPESHEQTHPISKSFVSFQMLEGFECFFPQAAKKAGLSYHQCYQKVMRSNFLLQKLRITTPQILSNKNFSTEEKFKQINSRSAAHERYYVNSTNSSILKIALGKEKEQQIQQLQRQLELYRRSGEDALAERRRQLKQVREEQERLRQREQEQRRRRAAVLQKLKSKQSQSESL